MYGGAEQKSFPPSDLGNWAWHAYTWHMHGLCATYSLALTVVVNGSIIYIRYVAMKLCICCYAYNAITRTIFDWIVMNNTAYR